jgi:short-subunit dehydrogenase
MIKPGPTATPMTRDISTKGVKLANVKSVAKKIVKGIEKKSTIIYVPSKWALIMRFIKLLPSFMFNRLDI